MFLSSKRYGHEIGLSSCFRQWRAASHCNLLHGYALSVKLEFGAYELDNNNWVVDFGGLKHIKQWLESKFDHKLLVAEDDPHVATFIQLQRAGLADIVLVASTGCESFARMIYDHVEAWLVSVPQYVGRVKLLSVEVCEHGANSATYRT